MLETARLVLRPLVAGDEAAYEGLDDEMTPEQAANEVTEAVEHWRAHGFGPWAVLERASGRLVAALDLHYAGPGIGGIAADEIEIGWLVEPASRGRGIATEAAHAVVEDAFGRLGIDRLAAYVRPWNDVSLRIVARLGMTDDGEGLTRSGDPMRIFRLDRADYDRGS